jgi:hypothetical protein
MPFPVRPSDFHAVVVLADDSLATAIVKTYIRLPILLYKLFKYMFNADGTFTAEFQEDLCDLDCATDDDS